MARPQGVLLKGLFKWALVSLCVAAVCTTGYLAGTAGLWPTDCHQHSQQHQVDTAASQQQSAQSDATALGHCGSWQQDYMKLHKEVLSGQRPRRVALAVGKDGLADCLVGAISVFYFALLTGRAFQMTLPGNQYEWAYSAPNIKWAWDPHAPQNQVLGLDPQRLDDLGGGELGPLANFSSAPGANNGYFFYLSPVEQDHKYARLVQLGNMSSIAPEYETVVIKSTYGMSVRLFDNPHHRQQLFRMGLRPDTAFGCAMNFLVRVKDEVRDMFKEEVAALTDDSALRIGIQIRTSDDILQVQPERMALGNVSSFFNCSRDLEATRRVEGQRVVWFLVSDSVGLRRAAKAEYGDKLLTNTDATVRHIHDYRQDGKEAAFQSAAAENWLFSLCDFHVISRFSGYGRSAAFWSRHWHNVFTVFNPTEDGWRPKNEARDCGIMDYDSLEDLSASKRDVIGDWHPGV